LPGPVAEPPGRCYGWTGWCALERHPGRSASWPCCSSEPGSDRPSCTSTLVLRARSARICRRARRTSCRRWIRLALTHRPNDWLTSSLPDSPHSSSRLRQDVDLPW